MKAARVVRAGGRWKRTRDSGHLASGLPEPPQCAAALAAVLEALGKRAGPEDMRSKWQLDHDALEEACAPRIVS